MCLYTEGNGSGGGGRGGRKTGVECLFRRAPATPATTFLLLFQWRGQLTELWTYTLQEIRDTAGAQGVAKGV